RTYLYGGQEAYQLHGFRRAITRDLRAVRTDAYTHWSETDTSDAGAGGGVSLAIDVQRDRLVAFGGDATSSHQDYGWGQFSALLMQRPLALDQPWRELAVEGETPSARMYASIVFDAVRRQLILFGGMGAQGALGDTWILAFDGLRPRWTRLDSTAT